MNLIHAGVVILHYLVDAKPGTEFVAVAAFTPTQRIVAGTGDERIGRHAADQAVTSGGAQEKLRLEMCQDVGACPHRRVGK